MISRAFIGTISVAALAGASYAGVGDINSLNQQLRIFNDFTTSNLVVTDNYPASANVYEDNFVDDGIGGNWANKHALWLSEDNGATPFDFDYGDGFDIAVTATVNPATTIQPEAGFVLDLFGFGFFGGLAGNGEVAAFGSTLPFHSFGTGVYTQGDDLGLRMIYRPGAGENLAPPSTIQYFYNINGGAWTGSPHLPYTNTEGGIPSAFNQYIGFGVQQNNALGGVSDVTFSDIVVVPTPGVIGLLGMAGLAGLRRRR